MYIRNKTKTLMHLTDRRGAYHRNPLPSAPCDVVRERKCSSRMQAARRAHAPTSSVVYLLGDPCVTFAALDAAGGTN